MARVRIHFDGWLSLPETVRRRFGIATGSMLDLTVTEDGALLRPAKGGDAVADEEAEQGLADVAKPSSPPVEESIAAAAPSPEKTAAEKPGRSRRKAAAGKTTSAETPAPAPARMAGDHPPEPAAAEPARRGRKPKVARAGQAAGTATEPAREQSSRQRKAATLLPPSLPPGRGRKGRAEASGAVG
jgi:bifunctional DNA-binding transcriptional regulator/antitoxin component of YhaV-PrlF toxin-antitoxin module